MLSPSFIIKRSGSISEVFCLKEFDAYIYVRIFIIFITISLIKYIFYGENNRIIIVIEKKKNITIKCYLNKSFHMIS